MKYAILIGIGYVNTRHALEGPLRDVYKIKESLQGYECIVLTDHTEKIPTKKVIVEAFLVLLQKEGPLFFYYSGHGQEDPEAILCADDELLTKEEFRAMLDTMNTRSTLIAVLDTCFSGNMFNLAYHWNDEWDQDEKDTPGHVFLISSSQEDEFSYEYKTTTGSYGGFTSAYLDTLQKPQTWKSLMEQVTLKVELQTPELSTGQLENLDNAFLI
jgi:hypothetical protein